MRKQVFGRKLKRTTNQRKALFKSLTNALILHGRITTTEAKAKAVRGEIEKLITHAKNAENALPYLQKHVALSTAQGIVSIAPVFKSRPGGYTRIIKMGHRKKDNASMVILEFVEKVKAAEKIEQKQDKKVEEVVKEAEVQVKAKTKEARKTVKRPVKK